MAHRYTLLEPEALPTAPFYINYGLFGGPPALLKAFYDRDQEIRPKVADYLGPWWAPQVSLALTCADLEFPTLALPMRYNFPNDPEADRLYPEEARNVILMHYLRTKDFNRKDIFASASAFDQFTALDLKGSNRIFHRYVIRITGSTYPFGR